MQMPGISLGWDIKDEIWGALSEELSSMFRAFPKEPYFSVEKIDNAYVTEGACSAFFGHKISRSDGVQDGVFAEWYWDGKSLIIRNDRYGFYPLYYFEQNGKFVVSPSIVMLLRLGAPVDLDYSALALFLRLDFFLNEDTPFKAIRCVPPVETMEWKDGLLHLLLRPNHIKENALSRSAAIDGYISLFRTAIQRRAPHNSDFGMPLSGGRDSRHILLELMSQGHKPKFAVTVEMLPPTSSGDVPIAAKLCQELGLSHAILDHLDDACMAEMNKNLLTDFCSSEHAWLLPAVEYLQWSECKTTYDGIGGDVLSNGLYLTMERCTLLRRRQYSDLARNLLVDDKSLGMLIESVRQKLDGTRASETLTKELQRHGDAPNPLASFIFSNRTRRTISASPYRLFKNIETVYSPYLDHDVYDFLIGLPDRYMVDHRFHDEAISRAFPNYAHIPYASKGPSSAKSSLYRRFTIDVMRHMAISPSPCVSSRFLWPRLVRCLLDRQYSSSVMWLAPLALYFIQLHNIPQQHPNVPMP